MGRTAAAAPCGFCGLQANGDGSSGAARLLQQWASPRRLLLLLCLINLLFFLDRGVVASNGVNGSADDTSTQPGISTAFDLSLFEDGLVAALYYVGVMIGAPVFAALSKCNNALRLIGVGGALFSAAALVCGFSQSFAMVLVFRCLVGAGTGSLIALGPPLIDDCAPAAAKALWLGIFYLCMPTGVAVGYLFGGAIGSGLTWRAAFWIEAGLAVPFALWCLLAPPVDIRRQGSSGVQDGSSMPLPAGSVIRLVEAELAGPAGGPAAATGDAAAARRAGFGSPYASEDNPKAAELELLERAGEAADCQGSTDGQLLQRVEAGEKPPPAGSRDSASGGCSGSRGALAGFVAACGTFLADLRQLAAQPVAICVILALTCWNGFIGAYGYYGPKAVRDLFGMSGDSADFTFGAVLAATGIVGSLAGGLLLDWLGATMSRGMALGAGGLGAGCGLVVVAVTAARSQAAFWPLFAAAQASVFLIQAPANACCMWAVPAGLRPFALSISEAMQHLLGDIPMPPALGAVQGAVDNWRLSLAVFALLLLLGAIAFLAGAMLARGARDYREEEQEEGVGGGGGTEGANEGSDSAEPLRQEAQHLLPLGAGGSVAAVEGPTQPAQAEPPEQLLEVQLNGASSSYRNGEGGADIGGEGGGGALAERGIG